MARETLATAAQKAKPKPTSQKKLTSKPKPAKLPTPIHPPYLQMISEAITALKERTGSSQQAIAKFIEEKYKTSLPPNFKKVLSVQLKKFAKSEKLVKVKNSFKLSAVEKAKKSSSDGKEKQIKKETVKKVEKESKMKEGEKTKKKEGEKGKKMKRLSQVVTPSALKRKKVPTPKKVPKSITSPKKKPVAKKARV